MSKKYPVYFDLYQSPFVAERGGWVFSFSSEFNLNRFCDRVDVFVAEQMTRIKLRFGIPIDLTEYLLFVFYSVIEKRGFLAMGTKGEVTQWESLKFHGKILMKANCGKPSETSISNADAQ